MKIIQAAYDYAKSMVQKGFVPNLVIGLALMLLTVAVMHQKTELNQLKKGSLETKILRSRRSAPAAQVVVIKTDHVDVPGAIYTRWGRTTCPAKLSELVYRGVAGGEHFTHSGGGSNYQCLPLDPSWGNFSDADESGARIFGAEYQLTDYLNKGPTGLFSDASDKTIQDGNVPCAVCQTLTPATIMMLPARMTCHSGWTLEYSGYLMAEQHNHKGRTQFTCMDGAPEADPAGYRNENGVLFYYVQSECGSLPCPPYVSRRELTCAVCSKRRCNDKTNM